MESSQDRNLPATERKLQKARTDGQAARSRDLSHLAILGAGAMVLLIFAPRLIDHLRLDMARQLAFDASTMKSPASMIARLETMAGTGLIASAFFAILTGAAALLSAVGAGGWVFSAKPITPDFTRLNPLKGAANLFSKQQMANVAKMILMTGILATVAWKYLGNSIDDMATLILQPSPSAISHVADWMTEGMALLLLVVFLAALVDVPLQSVFFRQRLKMSHQEVKQEHKESDGNPEIKGRMRQRQREIADRASVSAVPNADFVVMNPTHYAVALKYEEGMAAPQVIAKGTDLIAMRIRDLAKNHAVPVLQSPMLARALYANAELDRPIPATLYTAVAQVLAYVYRLKAALRGEGPMPGEVPEPFVPPELDPLTRATQQGEPA
ncbi:EscU/YscU/HrcU family type III secretion system export apparatus switch protein [Simplicispira suum]|uniref:Flagellar biosynthetic protein FlhB n=1 Tax=Simplicispira suum TaxID=2109915 RepID=A0A2S0N0C9_9BURK|nr:EscU/YscU/HrcU family type III secretion system export apparatus switch protein [Simplicispira suum]AVO41589.1 flagellar biosynthetic protein FlhB [Simplicispira suum]MBW7832840.1 EscU/YscU/HrcU family type III secretion system export apparatus switch protein [Simplicispira suum]